MNTWKLIKKEPLTVDVMCPIIIREGVRAVALIEAGADRDEAQAWRDAYLIEAAPELLFACQEFEAYTHRLYATKELGSQDAERVRSLVQMAISKATGGRL